MLSYIIGEADDCDSGVSRTIINQVLECRRNGFHEPTHASRIVDDRDYMNSGFLATVLDVDFESLKGFVASDRRLHVVCGYLVELHRTTLVITFDDPYLDGWRCLAIR